MEEKPSAAVVGVAGGAGATRLTVELGATLARAGRDVALLDAAFDTQGLARHVPGRIDTDVTALATGDGALAAALHDHPADAPGRLALCPAHAPFERLARAKTPAAAERLAALVTEAAAEFDHVLVDAPPVATNPAVAAVTGTDRVALVAPNTDRGVDALQQARGRLADVGAGPDLVVANRVSDDPIPDADRAVPETDVVAPETPTCLAHPESAFAPAVAAVAESLLDADLGLDFERGGALATARRKLAELS